MKKIALLCLVFFISAACLSTCGSPQRQTYKQARSLWESQGIEHYRFHLEIGCNCPWHSDDAAGN